ncbi:glycosyltransferase family 32 protein [Weissella cibaria]|uniref:glycosyltransferase family 32 protein n=1 Tax=Weissella cibaria TaxID=137591 RepID=UPI0011974117|nr:glycosyltransferase [Weissella cibaria]MCT8399547.1 hypothetical protein [Weissella cibaria]NKN31105.1 hypothetical protein [Weissella cibaria]NKN79982.1 hypothetical protein [Weissella cibaria]NKN98141.1 hypothetical protein [Weissella cibaria]NKO00281.1 hypothetical protein [Weissella cibaria]
MIPKIIHFVSLGPTSKTIEKKIEYLRRKFSDYHFILWNEDNWSISNHDFAAKAYADGQYAFVSDVIRLDVLYRFGGIYLDTDMIMLKAPDQILDNRLVFGFLFNNTISTSFMAAEPKNREIGELFKLYDKVEIVDIIGEYETSNNSLITSYLIERYPSLKLNNSLQELDFGVVLYPKEYFTLETYFDHKTIMYHEFSNSWSSTYTRRKKRIRTVVKKIIGRKNMNHLLVYKGAKRNAWIVFRNKLLQTDKY